MLTSLGTEFEGPRIPGHYSLYWPGQQKRNINNDTKLYTTIQSKLLNDSNRKKEDALEHHAKLYYMNNAANTVLIAPILDKAISISTPSLSWV